MFTLQVLDRGETSLFALDDRPVTIGSSPTAGLRLLETDVGPEHARLEPAAGGWRLAATGKVLVNGRVAQTVLLALGDRIEIGKAVLVVGKAVPRPRQPEDVLAEVVTRRRRDVAPPARASRWTFAVAGLLLLAVGYFIVTSKGHDEVGAELGAVRAMQVAGDLARADATLARLRAEWRDAQDDRLAQLDAVAAQGEAVRAAIAAVEQEVLTPTDTRTWAQWNKELQSREGQGDELSRLAARRVRANLRELIDRRPALADRAAQPAAPSVATPTGPTGPAAQPASPWREDARRLVGEGLFAQADAMLTNELGEATSAQQVDELSRERAAVRAQALAAMQELLQRAEALLAAGDPGGAADLLGGVRHRWPADAAYEPIAASLRRAEDQAAAARRVATAPPPATNPPRPIVSAPRDDGPASGPASGAANPSVAAAGQPGDLAALRQQLEQARQAEERDDFATLVGLLQVAEGLAKDRDPAYAARLAARAEEAARLAAWHQAVAAAGPRKPVVRLRDGRDGELLGVVDGQLRLRAADGEFAARWAEVTPAAIETLLDKLAIGGDARFGAVALLYRAGEPERAEQVLGKLLAAEPGSKATIDRVIARGRDEIADPRGYTWAKGRFVSARQLDVEQLGKQLAGEFAAALRSKDPAAWTACLEKAMARGPEAVPATTFALREELAAQAGKLAASGLKKDFDRLAEQRAALDRARDHARALIYDEVKYFYPYKPPAVSSDRFAEYNRVQAEVDQRVAAVRELWRDESVRVKVPVALRGDLERIEWLARSLANLGDLATVAQFDVDWARALPAGDSVGLREFCKDPGERAELEDWRRIDEYNTLVEKKVAAAVRDQLRITNAYRAMFRHRPLALVPSVTMAAQGHADEMSKLGYFSHTSPTPGRRTPVERMRLAGYTFGVTENIALVDGAQGAHDAWCRSSGHHRNLLNARHSEFGVGANGRYWVQNFGSGSTYTETEMWRQAHLERRR